MSVRHRLASDVHIEGGFAVNGIQLVVYVVLRAIIIALVIVIAIAILTLLGFETFVALLAWTISGHNWVITTIAIAVVSLIIGAVWTAIWSDR